MTYKAWRKDRLQKKKNQEKTMKKEAEAKIREEEEAKKKEVETAILDHVLVQSTKEDAKTATISGVQLSDAKPIDDVAAKEEDLKPRTVSHEEGEDDTAAPTYTTVDGKLEPKYEVIFSSYIHAEVNSDQNNKEVMIVHGFSGKSCKQNVHGIYGQRCMLDYAKLPGFHAFTRDTSAQERDVVQNELTSKERASFVRMFYQKENIKYSDWFRKENAKINFLFLFLPRKENIRDVIRMAGSWDFLCLCAIGWGPP
jgi:hypothetical protein